MFSFNRSGNEPGSISEPISRNWSKTDRFRIVMVAACPFPANYGSPGAIREMSESLSSLGHDVHIVTYPFGENITVTGPKIWRCRRVRKRSEIYSGPSLEKIFLDLLLLLRLCSVIRREKIDIIHGHNYEGALIGLLAKFLTGRPLVYNAVNLMSDELHTYKMMKPVFLAKWIARFLDWFIARTPDGFIAITENLYAALLKRGARKDRIALVPCGVNVEMFDYPNPQPLRDRYGIGARPVVMYTGINGALQRLDYLLRAFSLVLDKVPDAILMLVSPLAIDTDIQPNRKLAQQLGIEQSIIFVQGQSLDELPDYLALASVAVMSRPDVPGQPIKLLNYMAMARPIVCFNGAAKGIRHLHDAYLAPDHEWIKLGDAINTLLEDRELAIRLGINARNTVIDDFGWTALCRRIEDLYQTVTGRRSEEVLGELPVAAVPEHLAPESIVAD